MPFLGAGDVAPPLGAEGRSAARGRLSNRAPVPFLESHLAIWIRICCVLQEFGTFFPNETFDWLAPRNFNEI